MATKLFKLEVEYFGVKVHKDLEKLEDVVRITLSLGPYVKFGIRDTTNASIHTKVALYQPSNGSRLPPFSMPIGGGDGSLLLVPVSTANIDWRHIILNQGAASVGGF